jgi:hypothetical protein
MRLNFILTAYLLIRHTVIRFCSILLCQCYLGFPVVFSKRPNVKVSIGFKALCSGKNFLSDTSWLVQYSTDQQPLNPTFVSH